MTICGYLSLHCVLSQVAICPRSAPEDWQTQWMQSSSVHSLPGTHLPGSSICSTKNQKSSIKKSMCRGFGRLPQVLHRLQYKEKPMQNNFEAPVWLLKMVFECSITWCDLGLGRAIVHCQRNHLRKPKFSRHRAILSDHFQGWNSTLFFDRLFLVLHRLF